MITFTVWSDFACPYCYIGETRLKKAIMELGVEDDVRIDYRAFELNPGAPREASAPLPELIAQKYHVPPEAARQQIEKISALGRELGIDMKYADVRYTSTRDAHRLMKLAENRYDRATVERLNELLFKAYFVDNLVLADHGVLVAKAREAGMDEDEARAVLESDKYGDEVRYDEREAANLGVRGVPYIVFNDDFAVPGALGVDDFKLAVRRAMRDSEKAGAPGGNE